jgi:hypothetical protein
MDKIDIILDKVKKTNPQITREELIEELGKCEYAAVSLIMSCRNYLK